MGISFFTKKILICESKLKFATCGATGRGFNVVLEKNYITNRVNFATNVNF